MQLLKMIKLSSNQNKLAIANVVFLLIIQQCQLSSSKVSNSHKHNYGQRLNQYEYRAVTFGSIVKLMNSAYSIRLHLLDPALGTANNVTGVEEATDPNSYWQIKSTSFNGWKRGDPVPCGAKIKLVHQSTETKLYSKSFVSAPITKVHQGVSGNGNANASVGDSGDNWQVICSQKRQDLIWTRDAPVQLRHIDSKVYLGVTGATFGKSIGSLYEIVGMNYLDGSSTNWMAVEGIYIKPRTRLDTSTKLLRKK